MEEDGFEKRERLQMEMKGNEKKYINVEKWGGKCRQRARNTRLKEAENMKSDLMEIDVCFGNGKKGLTEDSPEWIEWLM